jgi:FixJ family two-component response regulator
MQGSADHSPPIVHLVEDDESQRKATARLLDAAGHTVRMYASAAEFLNTPLASSAGCVVLDVQLPGQSGLDVQRVLNYSEEPLPVIFLSGRASVPESVQAMKAGAVDFLTKADAGDLLIETIERALARNAEERRRREERRALGARYGRLSPREREVFAHLISGKLNKQVGFDLGISVQTTKIHRHRVFQKMKADSLLELARMADQLGVSPAPAAR